MLLSMDWVLSPQDMVDPGLILSDLGKDPGAGTFPDSSSRVAHGIPAFQSAPAPAWLKVSSRIFSIYIVVSIMSAIFDSKQTSGSKQSSDAMHDFKVPQ